VSVRPGDLVKWLRLEELSANSEPCIIVRGPREGYFEGSNWSEIKIVVDLFVDGKIVKCVPLEEVEKLK
jgi:hypothetical protein